MKINEAFKLGRECGLGTVGEALMNVEIHATSLFSYEDICDELTELGSGYKEYVEKYNINEDTALTKVLAFKTK